jgi:hypothetical protein
VGAGRVRIIRAGEHIQHIPGYGMSVRESGVAVAASANWWEVAGKTCVAAYKPKGAASLAASYSNLANPGTNDAAPGTAPDWDGTNGWKLNGTTHYLTTGLSLTNTMSVLVQFTNMTSAAGAFHDILGFYNDGTSGVWIAVGVTGTGPAHRYGNGAWVLTVETEITAGNLAIAGGEGYLNGSSEGSGNTGGASSSTNFYIGATFYAAAAYNFTAAYIQAVAFYSDTLTDEQVATVAAAMAAL